MLANMLKYRSNSVGFKADQFRPIKEKIVTFVDVLKYFVKEYYPLSLIFS